MTYRTSTSRITKLFITSTGRTNIRTRQSRTTMTQKDTGTLRFLRTRFAEFMLYS